MYLFQLAHKNKQETFNEVGEEEEIVNGELAYLHLIKDLAAGDTDLIEKHSKDAAQFMVSGLVSGGTYHVHMSHNMRLQTMWYVRPAKSQTILCICAV